MKRLILPVVAIALLGAGCAKPPADVPGSDDAMPKDTTPSVQTVERPFAGLGSKTLFRTWNDGTRDRCVFEAVYPEFHPRPAGNQKDDASWDFANKELKEAALEGMIATSSNGGFDLEHSAESYIENCRAELETLSKTLGENESSFMQYVQSVGYDTVILQDGIVSVLIEGYSYSGGAHGLPWIRGVSLTVPDGKLLTLGDLIDQDHLKPLMQMATRELRDSAGDALFPEASDGFSTFIADETPMTDAERTQFTDYDQFYLTPNGIVVYWNVYEVAPYAAGHQTIFIPYRTIQDWLLQNSPLKNL